MRGGIACFQVSGPSASVDVDLEVLEPAPVGAGERSAQGAADRMRGCGGEEGDEDRQHEGDARDRRPGGQAAAGHCDSVRRNPRRMDWIVETAGLPLTLALLPRHWRSRGSTESSRPSLAVGPADHARSPVSCSPGQAYGATGGSPGRDGVMAFPRGPGTVPRSLGASHRPMQDRRHWPIIVVLASQTPTLLRVAGHGSTRLSRFGSVDSGRTEARCPGHRSAGRGARALSWSPRRRTPRDVTASVHLERVDESPSSTWSQA